jgi:hypothetical protein
MNDLYQKKQFEQSGLSLVKTVTNAFKAANRCLGVIKQFCAALPISWAVSAINHVGEAINGVQKIHTRITPLRFKTFTDRALATLGQLILELEVKHRKELLTGNIYKRLSAAR